MLAFEPLDRASPLPLYAQLADRIGAGIGSGYFSVGDLLPSEAKLTSFFDVSRLTVRQAMAKLVNDGLVHRARGRGTYVRSRPVVHHFAHSFEEELAAENVSLALRLRAWREIEPAETVRAALRLKKGDNVFELDRLKLVDGEPIGFELRYLPVQIGRRANAKDVELKPVYRLIKDTIGLHVDRIVSTVSSVGASAPIAKQLRVRRHEPLLVREQTYFAQDDTPVMHGVVVFVGSRYRFMFECGPGQLKMDAFIHNAHGAPEALASKASRRRR